MYIRRKQLWWLLPIFTGLFLLGMAIGAWSDKLAADTAAKHAAEEVKRGLKDRQALWAWFEQWTGEEETRFDIYVKDLMLSGTFKGESFQLSGDVQGHQLSMKREKENVAVTIDGEEQEAHLMPFALYTPYDHLMLLKGQLQSVIPAPLKGESRPGLTGYQITVPGEEVKELLSLWLGPKFPTDEALRGFTGQMGVTYQLWLDNRMEHLRYVVVTLRMDTETGTKQDQLVFRL